MRRPISPPETFVSGLMVDVRGERFIKDKMIPLSSGPFYVFNTSLNNKFGPPLSFTLGGLRSDEDNGEVLAESGERIKGLYVAGRSGVGLCSIGYMSGLSTADTVFSGRGAGWHAARGGN